MTCPFCGSEMLGGNRERCHWCKEYYELTSDFGRELIDKWLATPAKDEPNAFTYAGISRNTYGSNPTT
jgi:hypothetical protein